MNDPKTPASPILKTHCGRELPEVLTVDLVANYLGVDRKLVYRAVRDGQLPAARLGARILISRSVLVDWLRQGRVSP